MWQRNTWWNRIARSKRGNGEELVIVTDLATDKRETTAVVHVITEEPDRAYAPNASCGHPSSLERSNVRDLTMSQLIR